MKVNHDFGREDAKSMRDTIQDKFQDFCLFLNISFNQKPDLINNEGTWITACQYAHRQMNRKQNKRQMTNELTSEELKEEDNPKLVENLTT